MPAQTGDLEIYLPGRRLWTVREFDRAGRLGLFRPGERLELIEGEVVKKGSPQASPHATAIYARALIPEYWIVNLQDRLLETLRDPGPDGYRDISVFDETAFITPLANASVSIAVSDLLP